MTQIRLADRRHRGGSSTRCLTRRRSAAIVILRWPRRSSNSAFTSTYSHETNMPGRPDGVRSPVDCVAKVEN